MTRNDDRPTTPTDDENDRPATARAEPRSDDDPDRVSGEGVTGREVVVPMRLYKTVTVFSTLLAMAAVIGGFVVLDTATNRAQLPLSEVRPALAVAGLGLIVLGAAIYAFSTRFRTEGMGKSKERADEESDDG